MFHVKEFDEKGEEHDCEDGVDEVEDGEADHVLPSGHDETPVLSLGALHSRLKNLFWHFRSEIRQIRLRKTKKYCCCLY